MPTKKSIYKLNTDTWAVERIIFLIAGLFIVVSLVLALFFDRCFSYFTFFVGVMLINFALSGYCPLAILIGKIKFSGQPVTLLIGLNRRRHFQIIFFADKIYKGGI